MKRMQSRSENKIQNEETSTEKASIDHGSALAPSSVMKSARKPKRFKYSTSKQFKTCIHSYLIIHYSRE
jgi:hypothetical protein